MTSKSNISSSTKSTNVDLLGKDIGQLLKTLLATTESATRVVTRKFQLRYLVENQNVLSTNEVKKYKVAPGFSKE